MISRRPGFRQRHLRIGISIFRHHPTYFKERNLVIFQVEIYLYILVSSAVFSISRNQRGFQAGGDDFHGEALFFFDLMQRFSKITT